MFLSLLSPTSGQSNETLTFEADTFCPFNCIEDGGGFSVEILERALKVAGLKLNYQEVPWSRAKKNVANGVIDGVVGGTGFTPELTEPKGLIYHKRPVGKLNMVFASLKGNKWKYKSPASFKGIRIGFVQSYDQGFSGPIGEFLKLNLKNEELIDVATGTTAGITNIKKLIGGRISLIIEDKTVLKYLLKKHGLEDKVEILQNLDKPMNFYIGFSSKNPRSKKLAKILDTTVEQLRKSGELSKILKKYNVTDWE